MKLLSVTEEGPECAMVVRSRPTQIRGNQESVPQQQMFKLSPEHI